MRENARKQGFGTRDRLYLLHASRMGVRVPTSPQTDGSRGHTIAIGARPLSVLSGCACESVEKNARMPILPYAPCVYEYSGAP